MDTEKETTAPNPSVAPDGEQPSALARIDSISISEEKHKQFGKIKALSMPELMETCFPVRPAVIEGLLPAGTYLLAGAPKIGKSFFVLQMAYQVSMGEPFLGFSSRPGTVLYLALEDTYERLQKRLSQMTERDSQNLVLSVLADTLDEKLLEQLADFLFEYPETVLVIIDTLQRIRGRTPDSCSYSADYDTMAKLKSFADTRFHPVSRTNGRMGAVEGTLILHKDKRTGSDAVLEVVGRDQPQMRLHLRFDPMHLNWELVKADTEPYQESPEPLLELVAQLLTEEKPTWKGTATELSQCLQGVDSGRNFTPNWIVRTLNARQEILLRQYGVRYLSLRRKDGKSIFLQRDGVR